MRRCEFNLGQTSQPRMHSSRWTQGVSVLSAAQPRPWATQYMHVQVVHFLTTV